MDRDDYRDKLLEESIRRRELQHSIEQSTAEDMISRQVNGGIDASNISNTLVDGRATEAEIVTQKNSSNDNHHISSYLSKDKSSVDRDGVDNTGIPKQLSIREVLDSSKKSKQSKTDTVSIKNIKDREKKRKLESKTLGVGYDKSKNVKSDDSRYSSSKETVPNRHKARDADAEDARRHQEAIYKKRHSGEDLVKNNTKAFDRKHKYISAIEDEPVIKFSKKLSNQKGRDQKKRLVGVSEGVVLKKVREGADDNYGIEALEKSIYSAKYGKKAVSSGGKFAKSASRTVRDIKDNVSGGITTKADLLRQQRNIEAKYKAARRKGLSIKEAMTEVKEVTIKVAHKAQEIIRKNLTLIISVTSVLIIMVAISAAVSSCASAVSQGIGTYVGGLSPTTDREMSDCDSYMDELENELQETINNVEDDYSDYDEYDYDLVEIGHDIQVLMAFLSAEYADYSLSRIQAVIDHLFDEMYTLDIWETVEIRTRSEYDPEIDDYKDVEYEYKILHVKLEKKELAEIVESMFTDSSSKERYDNYMTTGGAHQVYENPFDFNWVGDVSSPFGWRIHPITHEKKFHNGLDIAEPGGTPIKSVCTGTVIGSYFSSSAGNYIIVQDVTGYTVHYMHLNDRYVAEGTEIKRGELIGTVGTTGNSTGNHLHIGVQDETGEWLNPSFLLSTFVEP